MKKVLSSLVLSMLLVSLGYSMELAVSTAEAPREAHSEFIEKYRTKIEGKTARKDIPFAVVAAIMSSQAGADKNIYGNNFSLITANSKYAKVGKFIYADEWNGLMVFDRPRHNAEATVLVLQGWVKHKLGIQPTDDIAWLQALTHPETGLLPPERLAELAVAYEAATNTYLDLAQLNGNAPTIDDAEDIETNVNEAQVQAVNQELAATKSQLTEKEQKLVTAEQEQERLRTELIEAREELENAEGEADSARQKVVHLRNEMQSHKANPNPLFKSMLDIRGGIGFFKQEGVSDLSNAVNVELQYSYVWDKGIGLEAGVNMYQLSESEDFAPYINPFVGVSFGKYDNTIGFSIAPRAYYFMNPMLELETIVNEAAMTSRVKPTFMYGAGANVKLKVGDIGALTLYSNYMRGPFKLEDEGMLNEVPYTNTNQSTLNIFGGGIGLSFKL